MKIVCTKCGSSEVYVEQPPIEKVEDVATIDDMVGVRAVPAIYKTTTWKCKKCGYSVTG